MASVILIVMYNPGIQSTHVRNEFRYARFITDGLKRDVTAAILEHNADIIMLCELGDIEEGLGPTLSLWKETDSLPKLGGYHFVEDMLHELVSDPIVHKKHPSGWFVHAVNHYGLLASRDTVCFVDAPRQVGPLTNHQAYRYAQRCSFTANTDSVAKPVHAVDLWNVHCPHSRKRPYSAGARTQVCQFMQRSAGPRAIFGTDLNQSLFALQQQRWHAGQPPNGKHGDIVCWEGVGLNLKHIRIGKGELLGVSDCHVMVGIELQTEFVEDSSAVKLAESIAPAAPAQTPAPAAQTLATPMPTKSTALIPAIYISKL